MLFRYKPKLFSGILWSAEVPCNIICTGLYASEVREVTSHEKHIVESYKTEYTNKNQIYAALKHVFSF